MNLKQAPQVLKQLPLVTQVALVLFALVVLLLLALGPTTATSILAFLMALKAITAR